MPENRAFTYSTEIKVINDSDDRLAKGIKISLPDEWFSKFDLGEPVNVLVSSAFNMKNFPAPWDSNVLHTKHADPSIVKSRDDEPGVWLRAQDLCSIPALIHWCEIARAMGSPEQKVRNMEEIIAQIERYQFEHPELVKAPD